jgi:prolyl-tRNA editing enzyme YbaK/EbsC (Cys-tRNA(Pro) deacylase)/ubiquinone/menaquinone biosynthesis C-methylase UbiE
MSKWEERKLEHLALSDAAAEHYDALYENANFATGSYMRYELETIEKVVPQAPSKNLAIDLGCGTGRDSFVLARHFNQVYGYDFSQEMIKVAERNKLNRGVGNVGFEVLDIEDNPLPLRNGSVSFVNTAFGMGSFVKNPETLFREVRRVLQPRGIAVFSFYNVDALVNHLNLEWRPALAARVVEGEDALQVDFEGRLYTIAARPYTIKEIAKKLEGNFRQPLNEITTFPTLSALFPQTLFLNNKARELCTKVDQLLATNLDIAAGPYIVVVCQRGGAITKARRLFGYEKVLELLRIHEITEDIREHKPVRNMNEVKEILDASPSQMVKSILIAVDSDKETIQGVLNAQLFLIGIPADRKLDVGKVAAVIQRRRELIRFADQKEVEELTGFRVGSIPPFGLPRNIPVILDTLLANQKTIWCGTGKATESLRLNLDDLKHLSAYTVADVSKPWL